MRTTLYFIVLALLCVFIEGFFSMFEMALVSFDKTRLQYYASKNYKRAVWLQFLINKPSRLFGTTLIVVNFVLQLGSEAARRFFESISLSPDYASISQTLLVVIFAELSPMFAARRHSEHVALLCVPIVYFCSKFCIPFIWMIEFISKITNKIFKKPLQSYMDLSKEELQKALHVKRRNSVNSVVDCYQDISD